MQQTAYIRDGVYVELSEEGFGHALRVTAELHHEVSPYQSIRVVDTSSHGRMLLLDDLVMLTDRDECVYHEMIAHVPLLMHPAPERVLVVGGGDGGTIREVLRHPSVREAVLCEIDERVIEVSKTWFPAVAGALASPRCRIETRDAVAYVHDTDERFDVVLIDSTDPVGFAEGLFQDAFLQSVKRVLTPGGLYAGQNESPWLDGGRPFAGVQAALRRVFGHVAAYGAGVTTYPYGYWCFGVASDEPLTLKADDERMSALADGCNWWTPELQSAAFALPAFAKRLLTPPAG